MNNKYEHFMFYLVIDLKYFIQKIVWMCHVIWHRMILEYIDIAEVKLPCPRNNFWKRFAISRLTSVKLRCITSESAIARFDNTCNLYNNIHNLVNEQTLKKHYLHLSSIPRLLFRIAVLQIRKFYRKTMVVDVYKLSKQPHQHL